MKATDRSASADFAGQADTDTSVEVALAFEDNRIASEVFGQYDQNLAQIERKLNIVARANGNQITLKGTSEACAYARRVLVALYTQARNGRPISMGDVNGAIAEGALQGQLFPKQPEAAARVVFDQIGTRKRGPVKARNAAQDVYLRALKKYELVFAEGPAGTGKTWLAVGHAVALLEQGAVERLIISRPAVEAGERLGFLPGDLTEKVDPYMAPVWEALNDILGAEQLRRRRDKGEIEVAPIAFMRGRTLNQAFVVVDEAQNCSRLQMKMVLTRLGEGARMAVTGDPSQIDLPNTRDSGLAHAVSILTGVEGVAVARFTASDVVRHPLVERIVRAYDADQARGDVRS